MYRKAPHYAFSLVELVIVLVIVGVIAAIAVPRLTRGATNAARTAVRSDLASLRNAIELYRAEHEGSFPTLNSFTAQMVHFSNVGGTSFATSADVGNGIVYGPYLAAIPPLPVGVRKGAMGVAGANAADVGWIYNETTGVIRPNTTLTEVDSSAVLYRNY